MATQPDYQARYLIDCGVSPGMGVKYPDTVTRDESIPANDSVAAFSGAMALAETFAKEYLSNPDSGETRVQLVSLAGPDGKPVSFHTGRAVVKRTTLEHFLAQGKK